MYALYIGIKIKVKMIEEEMETIGIKDICAYVMSMAEIEDQSMRPKEIEDELESYLPKILEMDLDLLNKERVYIYSIYYNRIIYGKI